MSSNYDKGDAIAPNAKRLLWAGFVAILAAGVGFSIRGGILGDWGAQFGFTQSDLGKITGGGLTGFGIVILLSSLIADRVGYGKLMIVAFVLHFLSAVVTLAAAPLYNARVAVDPHAAKDIAFQCLFWGMFMFAIGNGIVEAVVNPLVATLFPKNRTHYLNILHAGWPGGLIIGGLASTFMVGKVAWEIQMSLFLIPVVLYGVMCIGQHFPKSEASQHGVSFGSMLAEFAAPVLLFL
ncbi:MAG TPA: MFS transporter, partial [Opitutaceae bacterium]|nr:MFS transporter [Opitutaceae bacterium]